VRIKRWTTELGLRSECDVNTHDSIDLLRIDDEFLCQGQ